MPVTESPAPVAPGILQLHAMLEEARADHSYWQSAEYRRQKVARAAQARVEARQNSIAAMQAGHAQTNEEQAVRRERSARPWQAAGYSTKGAWLADGRPGPVASTREE